MQIDEDEEPYEPWPAYQPDTLDTGLLCWMHPTRVCSAACMAYSPIVPEQSPVFTEQQLSCTLLVSVERISRSAAMLVKLTKEKNNGPRTDLH